MFKFKKNSGSQAATAVVEQKAVFPIIKGAFFAVFASLVLVLIFAFIIKLTNLSDSLVKPINQAIKVLSILAGVFYAARRNKGQRLLKGIFVGAIYVVLSFIVFSILDGSFNLSVTILNDLLFGAIAGGVSGIIVSLIK